MTRGRDGKPRNPKPRNPKEIRNPKPERRDPEAFGFRISDFLRAFGFRCFAASGVPKPDTAGYFFAAPLGT
jgi:hypothetical protein